MIGIIGAMEEEVTSLRNEVASPINSMIGMRKYTSGTLCNKDVVITNSGIGKVSASSVTAVLINCFHCDFIVNVGVAGGINKELNLLDVVISTGAVQHDFDLTVFQRKLGEVPNFPEIIPTNANVVENIMQIVSSVANKFNFKVFKGLIVSGDQFISSDQKRSLILDHFPDAYVAEMEGAAIAQVCYEFNVPFVIIRSVSDSANGDAKLTFEELLEYSTRNSQEILREIMKTGEMSWN